MKSRSCGHIAWNWTCRACASAYAREREKTRNFTPIWRELASKPWRVA